MVKSLFVFIGVRRLDMRDIKNMSNIDKLFYMNSLLSWKKLSVKQKIEFNSIFSIQGKIEYLLSL